MNDRAWLSRLRQGDERAFARLVDMYREPFYRLAYRLVGALDAEDVTQEIFVRIYRGLRHFREQSSLNTWVYRIAVNACHEWNRKRRAPEVPLEDEWMTGIDLPDPEHEAIQNVIWSNVENALESLDEKHRTIIVLHELQGLTYGEIAGAMELPVGTVKSRLHYAMRALRERLGVLESV
ncbi:MAG: sigma-70 family RNA polymerase sigma factor [Fimbriimonadia bacterium]|nr:sigma-70 family RNA polymerase sigma factor [Fimbriimonadia bacterium]